MRRFRRIQKSMSRPRPFSRPSRPDGSPAYNAPRGAFTGKGKQKRDVVSTMNQSLHRNSRAKKAPAPLPAGVTGTAEQGG